MIKINKAWYFVVIYIISEHEIDHRNLLCGAVSEMNLVCKILRLLQTTNQKTGGKILKEFYETPETEVIRFENEDIITTSNVSDTNSDRNSTDTEHDTNTESSTNTNSEASTDSSTNTQGNGSTDNNTVSSDVTYQDRPDSETPIISNGDETTESTISSDTSTDKTVSEEQEEIPIVTESAIEFPFIPVG